MSSNWVYESSSSNVRKKAEKVLTELKHKKYKSRKVKSIRYEQIPGIFPRAFREIVEYED
jgi:hypothetical protein